MPRRRDKSLFSNNGREEASWQRFHDEGIDRFLNGTFAGAYQNNCSTSFTAICPISRAIEQ